jgi:hypothetical protein
LTTTSTGVNVKPLLFKVIGFRRILSRIAVAWLVCHATTLTLGPMHLWLGSGDVIMECKCAHGDHAMCPMHHKPAPGSKLCVVGSPSDDGMVVRVSLFSDIGLLPELTFTIRPEAQRVLALVEHSSTSLRPPPPDPPPPRL